MQMVRPRGERIDFKRSETLMQSSQNLELVMMWVIDRQLWSANKRLLADRYSLPIRDNWQTVHKICKRSPILLLLAGP